MDRVKLGEKLKELREDKGLTQQDVADALGIGRSGYAQYETGRNAIAGEDMPRLAKILKVPLATLFDQLDMPMAFDEEDSMDQEGVRYLQGMSKSRKAVALAQLRALYEMDDNEDGGTIGKKAA